MYRQTGNETTQTEIFFETSDTLLEALQEVAVDWSAIGPCD